VSLLNEKIALQSNLKQRIKPLRHLSEKFELKLHHVLKEGNKPKLPKPPKTKKKIKEHLSEIDTSEQKTQST